jgi:hypothetical protein
MSGFPDVQYNGDLPDPHLGRGSTLIPTNANADDLGKTGGIAPKTPRSSQPNGSPVILLADRSRIVRLIDFDTSDGPDVHVILSDQPAGSSDHAVDGGSYVKLGKLKGTSGNQSYPGRRV